jgi:hypothetical protein
MLFSLRLSSSSKPLVPSVSPFEHHDSHIPFRSFTTHQAEIRGESVREGLSWERRLAKKRGVWDWVLCKSAIKAQKPHQWQLQPKSKTSLNLQYLITTTRTHRNPSIRETPNQFKELGLLPVGIDDVDHLISRHGVLFATR